MAGALALLLSAFPYLTVDQQRAALSTTAVDLGSTGPDDTYGAGRLDALAAYKRESLYQPAFGWDTLALQCAKQGFGLVLTEPPAMLWPWA
ncbi:MAG: S8 family peptidase [Dehalococcoidia bacterium]|nr:S8 family peptidase [Dehalococcoidia bacterium]